MNFFARYPAARPAIFLAIGIVIGAHTNRESVGAEILLCGLLAVVFLLLILTKRWASYAGPVGLALLVVLGSILVFVRAERYDPTHISNQPGFEGYVATICSAPVKNRSWQYDCTVESVCIHGLWSEASGRVRLSVMRTDSLPPYVYGDVLLIAGMPGPTLQAANPHSFDYSKFLARERIYHQQRIEPIHVLTLGRRPPNRFFQIALDLRAWCVERIRKYVPDAASQSFVIALVLGLREDLDPELLSAYGDTGSMHVLAVSGLHVGILYGILVASAGLVRHARLRKWMMPFVILVTLWMYAAVTGFSPSVLRAVTMLTFFVIAPPLRRRTNPVNTLFAASFVLLVFDPFLVFKVGFQLSFMAVLGILTLYRPLSELIQPKWWITRKIWQMTAVSFAAQAGTALLGVYYFHQFPVSFLIANLLVIPGSFLVLVGGLLLLTLGGLPALGNVLGWLLHGIVSGMNTGVDSIAAVPFSVWKGLYLTDVELLLSFAMIIAIICFLICRRMMWLGVCIVLCFVCSGERLFLIHQASNTARFTVYSIHEHTAIEWTKGRKSFYWRDPALDSVPELIRYHVEPNRMANLVASEEPVSGQPFVRNFPGCCLVLWQNRRVLLILDKDFSFTSEFPVDYAVVCNNAILHVREMDGKATCGTLVIDSSNSWSVSNRLLTESQGKAWAVHSVPRDGCFEHVMIVL
jgi:competence protein ComEC